MRAFVAASFFFTCPFSMSKKRSAVRAGSRRSVALTRSFHPLVLREVVIHGASALELPAHLSPARPPASENIAEEREQHPPGFSRLFGAVASRHGVVQPAVRHAREHLHAVAAAAVLQGIARAADIGERDRVIALAVDEEHRGRKRAHHLLHRLRLQIGHLPIPLLRAAVEHHESREIAPPASDHDRIAPALAHAHERDTLRRDARMALQEIERRVDHRGDLGIGQDRALFAASQRRLVAFPAREEIRRESRVTVPRETLRQVERVLHQAVALVQDDDGARRRFASRQIEKALAVPAEAQLVHVRDHAYFCPFRKSACQRLSQVSHSSTTGASSTMRKLRWSNELSTLRFTGTRLAAMMKRWPSGDSTKSTNRSAACGCGACFATPMPSARPNAGGSGFQSIGAPRSFSLSTAWL